MKTDKKITIKVVSKTEQRIMSNPDVEMITEWNIKRIVYALLLLLLLVFMPGYYLSSLDEASRVEEKITIEKPLPLKQTPIKEDLTQAEKEAPIEESVAPQETSAIQEPVMGTDLITPEASSHSGLLSPNISRAQLAQGVSDKEPYGQVKLPLIVTKEKAEGLFYFTEVMNMKGNKVLHEWWHQGKRIYKRTFIIRGNRWRISTSKLFDVNYIGHWQVRSVTKQGEVLHSLNFSVVTE